MLNITECPTHLIKLEVRDSRVTPDGLVKRMRRCPHEKCDYRIHTLEISRESLTEIESILDEIKRLQAKEVIMAGMYETLKMSVEEKSFLSGDS